MDKLLLISTFFILAIICNAQSQSLQNNICPPNMVNFEGNCFNAIPNCQYYALGAKCVKCNLNFTLIEGQCGQSDKLQETFLLTFLQSKSLTITAPSKQKTLTYQDASNFINVKKIVISKYPNMTSTKSQPVLKNVMKTSFNSYFAFTWVNTQNKTFLFEYRVDPYGVATELIADFYNVNLQSSLFNKINDKTIEKSATKLSDATLTKIVLVSKNLYRLNYYTDFGFHYSAFIQKIPYLEIKPLESIAWKYDQTEMLTYIYSQHPSFSLQKSFEVKKRMNTTTLQYDVKFQSGAKVVLEEFPSKRERIIFFYRQQNQAVLSGPKPLGTYQLFKNKEDSILQKVLNNLYTQFAFLKTAQVTKIEYQIVSGTNFMIYLKDSSGGDEYMCKAFYSLSSEVNILELYMNSVLIHTQSLAPLQMDLSYNYSADPIYQKVSNYVTEVKKIKLGVQVSYVNNVKKANLVDTFYQFDIVYQKNSFITVNYFIQGPRRQEIQVIDLVLKGNNQLTNDSQFQKIKDFLQSYKKWLNPVIITYAKETKPNEYLLKIITEQGSYFFKLINTESNGFQIFYYQLIDQKERCITHSQDEIHQFQFQQLPFINDLKQNNKIDSSSDVVSFSETIFNSKLKIRLLFLNPNNYKKTEVIAVFSPNGLQVDKITSQNNGLSIITDTKTYTQAVLNAASEFSQTLQSAKPILGMINDQNIQIYFQKTTPTKETVFQIQMNLNLSKGSNITTFFEQNKSTTCNSFNQNKECQDCKDSTIPLLSQCYDKIKSCSKQIGKTCLICQDQYSLRGNQCINQCSFLM